MVRLIGGLVQGRGMGGMAGDLVAVVMGPASSSGSNGGFGHKVQALRRRAAVDQRRDGRSNIVARLLVLVQVHRGSASAIGATCKRGEFGSSPQ